ncbi:hypothetical protein DP117_20575 [Brasilonema sp. UFV-L1]|nr:hypothetical protein [Brasilonema sp. UFV-L1]
MLFLVGFYIIFSLEQLGNIFLLIRWILKLFYSKLFFFLSRIFSLILLSKNHIIKLFLNAHILKLFDTKMYFFLSFLFA